jgi:hypothetical protein
MAKSFLDRNANVNSITRLRRNAQRGRSETAIDASQIISGTFVVGSFGTNVKITAVGSGFYVKEGTNATMGKATLIGGTVVVSTTKVTANSRIFLTTDGGTLTHVGSPYISARTAGTSFTITSTNALDVSDVAWIIIEPA